MMLQHHDLHLNHLTMVEQLLLQNIHSVYIMYILYTHSTSVPKDNTHGTSREKV